MIALARACLHFSAETAYAAGRATFLDRMMEEHCAGLKERSPAILADTATNAPLGVPVETLGAFA